LVLSGNPVPAEVGKIINLQNAITAITCQLLLK